jgi:hypothetical protein
MQLMEQSEQMQHILLSFVAGLHEIPFCSQQQQVWATVHPMHSGNLQYRLAKQQQMAIIGTRCCTDATSVSRGFSISAGLIVAIVVKKLFY